MHEPHTNGARAHAQAHGASLDATSHQPIWDSDERRAVMREAGGWEQPYQRLAFPESLPQVRPPFAAHLLAGHQPRPVPAAVGRCSTAAPGALAPHCRVGLRLLRHTEWRSPV